MSDTTNTDTSTLDQKREELDNPTSTSYYSSGLLKSYIFVILFTIVPYILIHFSLGGLVLYICKLAQSNVLPTNDKCYPYTDIEPVIDPIKINIFPTFSEPKQSIKMTFPYKDDPVLKNYNAKNLILDFIHEKKTDNTTGYLANYFMDIIGSLFRFNYGAYNVTMNVFNEYIPEFLIIFFGPLYFIFISFLLFLFNNVYAIYLWFACMSWFFKENENTDPNHEPIWKNISQTGELLEYIMKLLGGVFVAIVFCILFALFFMVCIPTLPAITVIWVAISLLLYKSRYFDFKLNNKGEKVDESYVASSFTILLEMLKYYKVWFMAYLSFYIVTNAFTLLGSVPGIFSIIVICLIYFGYISINAYVPNKEVNLSNITSYLQATKKCKLKTDVELVGVKKEGMIKQLLEIPIHLADDVLKAGEDLLGVQKGGSILKRLKKMHKK